MVVGVVAVFDVDVVVVVVVGVVVVTFAAVVGFVVLVDVLLRVEVLVVVVVGSRVVDVVLVVVNALKDLYGAKRGEFTRPKPTLANSRRHTRQAYRIGIASRRSSRSSRRTDICRTSTNLRMRQIRRNM